MKETFLYDRCCSFCVRWVKYWKRLTGSKVDYKAFQDYAKEFPQIDPEAFFKSSQFVDAKGEVYSGARGVAELLAYAPEKRWFKWWYVHVAPFKMIAEFFYAFVSSCRVCGSKFSKFFWGRELKPSTFVFTRHLFLRLLGLVYLIAFLSLWTQIPGLIGETGILPVNDLLESAKASVGLEAYFKLPTLAWLSPTTGFLQFIALMGAVLGLLAMLGIQLAPLFFLLWIAYLSLFYAGQIFMGFQWDLLLLEVGFLAIFFAPLRFMDKSDPPHLMVWLFRLLVFKLMFSSGFVKLASADPTWANLTALDFHYFTQPIPNVIAWFAHTLPRWFQHLSVLIMFGVQLILPFFIFTPRRLRHFAAFCFIALELIIMFTGNFAFFNLLTITLILLLFDDQFFNHAPARKPKFASKSAIKTSRTLAVLILVLSILSIPTSLRIVNSYGLFAVMTTERNEIVMQGSLDGNTWLDYEFKYKAGNPFAPPAFVAPHQPRLDWQMWFAALGTYEQNPWFTKFAKRLLEASPEALDLLEVDPFDGVAPTQVRAALYEYEFTTAQEREQTGAWWKREAKGLYLPSATLNR
jgi:lipase maturation factor 1